MISEPSDLLSGALGRGHSAVAVLGLEDKRGRLSMFRIEGRDVMVEVTYRGRTLTLLT